MFTLNTICHFVFFIGKMTCKQSPYIPDTHPCTLPLLLQSLWEIPVAYRYKGAYELFPAYNAQAWFVNKTRTLSSGKEE